MASAPDDAADLEYTGELRFERVGHVVLAQFASAPARHVEEAIVDTEIDVCHERGHGLERLKNVR
ncbi:hypothetical protein HRbin27_01363 [bacterium HR27]|nr:hypothetical protein HRbin27_01363 [bacterium HR27]